jgi:chaperone required for assembly of F1-ATPase
MNDELNPMRRAQAAMRTVLPKRFFKDVTTDERGEGRVLLLDGRPTRTPARRLLALPNVALAEAVADEWRALEDVIDPSAMPLTRLSNLAIDAVAEAPVPVIDEIVEYAGTDLLYYRAPEPEGLVAEQNARWNPLIDAMEARLGVRFLLAEGIVHVAQPEAALAAVRQAAEALSRPFALTAAASATNLSGSALIALALAAGLIGGDEAWNAAHVDEQWNISRWGEDADAQARLAARHAEFAAAARMLRLVR